MKEITLKEFLKTYQPDIALIVATDQEFSTIKTYITPIDDYIFKIPHEELTYYCGLFGKYLVSVTKSNRMGSGTNGGSMQTTAKVITDFSPKIIIMPGIAFGANASKQKIGDILISQNLALYENTRINKDSSIEFRGSIPDVNLTLYDRFTENKSFSFEFQNAIHEVSIHKGLILSGDKLIDNSDYKQKLLDHYSNAIGGEMEGSGIYASSSLKNIPWIVIKSICDWANGEKNKLYQELAAESSIQYVLSIFQSNIVFESFHVLPYSSNQDSLEEIKIDAHDLLSRIIAPRNYQTILDSKKSSNEISKKKNDSERSTKKIHYEYYSLEQDNRTEGYLFLGKNINITNVFKEFVDEFSIPDHLEIYITKKYNKDSGKLIDRKGSIQDKINQLNLFKRTSIYYIEDVIWESSKLSHLISSNDINKNYIDQQIYSYNFQEEREFLINDRSVDFFKKQIALENTPVSVVFGSGGVGKTTFCKTLEEEINSQKNNKKVFLIKGERIEFCPKENKHVNSLEDLLNIFQEEAGFSGISIDEINLNTVCGNLIIIIDALDEIEAILDTNFNLENFFSSLHELEKRFFSTKIIVTIREQFKNKIQKIAQELNINYYTIKGFAENDLNQYLSAKYDGEIEKHALVKNFLNAHNLSTNSFIIPLFVHWTCQIIDFNTDTSYSNIESKMFISEEKIDRLFMELINREKEKKQLQHIELDDFFYLLKYIIVNYHGSIPIQKLQEYCDEQDINKSQCNAITQMTFLNQESNNITIKYDILHNIIKTRFLYQSFKNQYQVKDETLKILKEMYLGKYELFDEFIRILMISENTLKKYIAKTIQELILRYENSNKLDIQKSISSLLYILIKKCMPTQQIERTELINEVYKNDINHLYIYGDFYPIDFNNVQIKHSLFDAYMNFENCNFPVEEKVIFSDVTFNNIEIHRKIKLSNSFFKNCIYKNTNIGELIKTTENKDNKNLLKIKNDLKSITRLIDNSQKSLNLIKLQCSISFQGGDKKFVELLCSLNYLEKFDYNGEKYKISKQYRSYIEDTKIGSFISDDMLNLIKEINAKV